jgi:hypothetical protein
MMMFPYIMQSKIRLGTYNVYLADGDDVGGFCIYKTWVNTDDEQQG